MPADISEGRLEVSDHGPAPQELGLHRSSASSNGRMKLVAISPVERTGLAIYRAYRLDNMSDLSNDVARCARITFSPVSTVSQGGPASTVQILITTRAKLPM